MVAKDVSFFGLGGFTPLYRSLKSGIAFALKVCVWLFLRWLWWWSLGRLLRLLLCDLSYVDKLNGIKCASFAVDPAVSEALETSKNLYVGILRALNDVCFSSAFFYSKAVAVSGFVFLRPPLSSVYKLNGASWMRWFRGWSWLLRLPSLLQERTRSLAPSSMLLSTPLAMNLAFCSLSISSWYSRSVLAARFLFDWESLNVSKLVYWRCSTGGRLA